MRSRFFYTITCMILFILLTFSVHAACDPDIGYSSDNEDNYLADTSSCIDQIPLEDMDPDLIKKVSDSGRINEISNEQWKRLYPNIRSIDLNDGEVTFIDGVITNGDTSIDLVTLDGSFDIKSYRMVDKTTGEQIDGFVITPDKWTILVTEETSYTLDEGFSYDVMGNDIILPKGSKTLIDNGIEAVTIDATEDINVETDSSSINIYGGCNFFLHDQDLVGSINNGGSLEMDLADHKFKGNNVASFSTYKFETSEDLADYEDFFDVNGNFEVELKDDYTIKNVILGSETGKGNLAKGFDIEASNLWGPLYVEFSDKKTCEHESCLMIKENGEVDVTGKGAFSLFYSNKEIHMVDGSHRYVENPEDPSDSPPPKPLILEYPGIAYNIAQVHSKRGEGVAQERPYEYRAQEGTLVIEMIDSNVKAWIKDPSTGKNAKEVEIDLGGTMPDSVFSFLQDRSGIKPEVEYDNKNRPIPMSVFDDIQPYFNDIKNENSLSSDEKILEIAQITHFVMDQTGMQYAWGGEPASYSGKYHNYNDGRTGSDCSGYVGYVMCSAGIDVFCQGMDISDTSTWDKEGDFSTADDQSRFDGKVIVDKPRGPLRDQDLDKMEPGDIIWTQSKGRMTHIMIYAGEDADGNHYVYESSPGNRDFAGVPETGAALDILDNKNIVLVKRFKNENDAEKTDTSKEIPEYDVNVLADIMKGRGTSKN